ncbi:hypothetical protein [uncultured Aquimarina sp.]|uniref:hypothetical protein n=1 Tax=uncultured Aquimarina sp. TaxID=575652 RepID=UPI002606F18F|nr:hypothetical protein [uncultured Aquimarina sp.]
MKTIIIILSIFAITSVNSQAAYEKGMGKAFELWGNQKNDEAANLFERIGKAEKDNWLPFYYAAQIHIVTTFGIKDAEQIESRLTKAQNYLNEAKTFSKGNAEIMIMEAMLNTAYVVYDGAKYGMTHSAKVEELYQKAKIIEPENPRAILYHAEWQMGAAKFWGKDPKAFCPEIEKAISLFDLEKSTVPFYPSWGEDQIERIKQNCK